MTPKEKSEHSKPRKSYKTYLFFLAFTAFIWFALKFTNNYSQEIEFDVSYTELPKRKIIKPNSDNKVKMILNGSGMQLLKYTVFTHNIGMDVRKASTLDEKHAFFTGEKMNELLKSSLGYSGEITDVFKDSLHIYYDVFGEKKIPIKIITEIDYSAGYTSVKGVQTPEKWITITAPQTVLDTLKFIETEPLRLTEIKKNYKGTIAINKNKIPKNTQIDVEEIPITLNVDKLTEGEFQIPISLLNVPKGIRVQLFPKRVGVVFSVALQDYPKLNLTDFRVTANMMKREEGSNKLLLKLQAKPDFVYNARLSEKEVQYILIK